MFKKKALPAVLAMASLAGVAIDAHAEISANAALVSDYRFRGISQSNDCLLYTSDAADDRYKV